MMNNDLIVNKVDFQRHLNGCERRLNDLTKSIQIIEKLFLNNNPKEQEIFFNKLNEIIFQEKFLYSSILKLDQCSFALSGKKRLDYLKTNLEKNRIKFEQIKSKFNYELNSNDCEQINESEQLRKLINKKQDEEIELDLIQQQTVIVNHLEQDLTDLKGTFIDLNRIIHEQGTMVNNIEQALTKTDEIIYEAKENVKISVEKKKRLTRTKWILISFFLCAFLLLLIIIYFTLKLAFPFG